jgi:hypothetical protein
MVSVYPEIIAIGFLNSWEIAEIISSFCLFAILILHFVLLFVFLFLKVL